MQLRQCVKKEIDGEVYEITQLGAISSSKVFVRLVKILGPAIAAKDFTSVFENLRDEDVDYFIKAFAPLTCVPGVADDLSRVFDMHFAGRIGTMLQWLVACIDVNFGDFLKGSAPGGRANPLGQALGSLSNSLPAATGRSGVS